MNTLKAFFSTFVLFIMIFVSFPAASAPLGFFEIKNQQIQEDDVVFNYSSNDGSLDLKCTAFYEKPESWDWDVWCGKGTSTLKIFRVHFLLRKYKAKDADKTAYEVLYLVTDRNQPTSKAFSSTSQWLQFKRSTDAEVLSFSQGVENDYAYLTLKYQER